MSDMNKRYPVWQLLDGTVVIQADKEQLTAERIRAVKDLHTKKRSWWVSLKHQFYTLLEKI